MKPGTIVIMTFKGVDSEQMIAMETDKYYFLAIPYSMYPINKETLEYKNPIYPEMNFKIREIKQQKIYTNN